MMIEVGGHAIPVAYPARTTHDRRKRAEVNKYHEDWLPNFRWKQLYSGLTLSDLHKLRQVEKENQKMKRLVADPSLDKAMLQNVLENNLSAWPASRDRLLGS